MLISSWLKSFRNHLQTRPRRVVRRSRITTPTAKRAEDLEVRSLLAAPTLVAVRPNVGEFLVENEVRDTSPNELTLQFNPGQVIDVATLEGNVQVDRAGHDGTFGDGNEVPVTIGFVGIGDQPEEVVIRFAENLPDDHYRITVTGGLQNENIAGDTVNNGEAFNGGVTETFDFSLDLGARIVAVDPQPVTRDTNGNLSQAANQIVLYFNEDDLDVTAAEDERLYQLISTNDTVSNLDDNFTFPDTATYDSVANTVTLEFSGDIDTLFGAGTYRLRVGNRLTGDVWPPAAPTPFIPGTEAGSTFATAADLGALVGTNASRTIDGEINITTASDQVAFPFDFPGAEDEPGHRQVEAQTHLNAGADADPEILTQFFNFDPVYGDHPNNALGLNPTNSITEGQKQRAREIFEFYGTYLGIDFVEADTRGFTIATGDIRVLSPTAPTGASGVLGIAAGNLAIMDDAEPWEDKAGGDWFLTAMHEIGHLLGVGHAAELPQITINSANSANGFIAYSRPGVGGEPDYPGDHDIVHGLHLHRSDSIDVDRYNFSVPTTGTFSVEVVAERAASSSLLDSKLTLFKRVAGEDVQIARNDDYFSEDSFLELLLEPGDYSLAIASTDNGAGGTSQGEYNLRVNFLESTNPATSLIDADLDENGLQNNTEFDGDNDGEAGGVYNFWFTAAAATDTLFVDKLAPAGGNGAITSPFNEIDVALAAATPGQIVRILGNDIGNDGDQTNDQPYLIGQDLNNNTLVDGSTLDVPKGVTVMIDAGAIFKLRSSRIGVGSSSTLIDRSGGALQVLGTPDNQVIFTSLLDEVIGGDTTSTPTTPDAGNWGGLSFRNDVDEAQGRFSYRSEGIFLNHVGQAQLRFGGGNAVVDSILQPVNAINMIDSQPTITYNTITLSADSALAANPDSFEELTFHTPEFQEGAALFNSDYKRIGPDISWNVLTQNSTNGLFVKVTTAAGADIEKMTIPGRFDDTDIVHVIAQNLALEGTPGGPILDETPPDIALLTPTIGVSGGTSTWTAAGAYNYDVVFVDRNGFESPNSGASQNATVTDLVNNTIVLTGLPPASGDYVGRRVYRSAAGGGGPYTLVAELDSSNTAFTDNGGNLGRTLTPVNERRRARTDASLVIDPGVIVKLEGSRIEAEVGTQLIAEGHLGQEVIFTSRRDDRYGAGGTFDTNDDDNNANEINPVAGDWGGIYIGHLGSVSIDHALITFGGGITPLESDFAAFNALEIHQATARIRNSVFEDNGDGQGGSSPADRFGLYENASGAIFVRGSQPVILDNSFENNAGPVITINTNAVNSLNLADPGRSTGHSDQQINYIDNQGPLVRDNAFENNEFNGMEVRGEVVTTQGVWDDTDIVHVLRSEIFIPDLHVSGGIRLESSATESLVVKLEGANAGITTGGNAQDIVDRIGGMLHVIGQPGSPVIFTSTSDDSAGAGFDLSGFPQFDTNSDGLSSGTRGDWAGLEIEQLAHDRNVGVHVEAELADAAVAESNVLISDAEVVGLLAAGEYSADENLRLGFEIHGTIDSFADADTYSFEGVAGEQVWLDIDKSSLGLDTIIELLDSNGNVLATSDNDDASVPAGGSTQAFPLDYSPYVSRDLYTLNALDAGMRVVLPGSAGVSQNYFVRVSSQNSTAGIYQLQIRLKEIDEFPGTTIQHADIRFATNGIVLPAAPIHSPLTGEFVEVDNANIGALMNSDRAALSVSGTLAPVDNSNPNNPIHDEDRYTFTVFHNPTQASGNGTGDTTPVSVVFDVDFADGQSRANSTIAVYNSNNELVLIGRDSNIADDQEGELNGDAVDLLSRGSYGHLDPFIGPVELNPDTYTMQVFANDSVPTEIANYLTATGANLVRLEPVDTVQRVAEERFEANDGTTTGSAPIVDLFTVAGGQLSDDNIVPFSLADLNLFVSSQGGVLGGTEQTTLSVVDPFTGVVENTVGEFGQPVRDIAMRDDGQLYAYTIGPQTGNFTPGNTGNYLQIDTGTAAATNLGDDALILNRDNLTGTPPALTPVDNNVTADGGAVVQYNALLHTGTSQWNGLAVGDRIRNGTNPPANSAEVFDFDTNILYGFDISTGLTDNRANNVNDARAYNGPGSTQRAIGQIGTQAGGTIVGLAEVGGALVGLDDDGFLYFINQFSAASFALGQASTYDVGTDSYIPTGETFSGLATAPVNVEGGAYADLVFAITTGGDLFALNFAAEAQPIFLNGADSISTGINGAHGLAFSTLDVNPWHLTNTGDTTDQEDVEGHGIIEDVDTSRLDQDGNTSLYFGSTSDSAAAGNQNNLSTTEINDYNFPGGAHGSVVSNEFDLSSYTTEDKPTLYFNYLLETDGTDGTQRANSMQDAFRVFVADESGDWNLIVTNNSFEDSNLADEFDRGPNGSQSASPSLQSFPDVNEAFDGAGWRQARIDLSNYAGSGNLRLRFDFSTAGAMDLVGELANGTQIRTESELVAIAARQLQDGDTFQIDGVTFEFEMGPTLNLPSGDTLAGATFDVSVGGAPTTFTFVTAGAGGTNILATPADSASTIAQRVLTAINSELGAGTAFLAGSKVNVPMSTVTATGALTVSGATGFAAAQDVTINVSMTADEVAVQIQRALAEQFSGWVPDDDLVARAALTANQLAFQGDLLATFDVHNSSIRIIEQAIRDEGPLTARRDLPGDEFGSFGEDVFSQGNPGSTRGQNNANLGVFIDDIIIGFAERGEQVLNAGAGTGIVANPHVSNPDRPVGLPYLDILSGAYDLEVRRGGEVAEVGPPGNALLPAMDTNDRAGELASITVPDFDDIADNSTFAISDGVNDVTFQFVDNSDGTTGGAVGNIVIQYSALTQTAIFNNATFTNVAAAVRAAINSNAVQGVLDITASLSDGVASITANNTNVVNLTGNAIVTPGPTSSMVVTAFDSYGDSNQFRDQGQIIINSSIISNSDEFGIRARLDDPANPRGTGQASSPGGTRSLLEINDNSLVPGVVISNNLLFDNESGGIELTGEPNGLLPQGVVPVARIINNTIVGSELNAGVGIDVRNNAAPTIMNNIIADYPIWINVDASSQAADTVIGSNLYRRPGSNSTGNILGDGTFGIILNVDDPLFVDEDNNNFYLAPGSRAIDSGLASLLDRPDLVTVKTALGLGLSPTLAPEDDLFGQVRSDDSAAPNTSGQGSNVFIDRGAIDRVDFFQPTAEIVVPQDGSPADLDLDEDEVLISGPQDTRALTLRLVDQGIGIDDTFDLAAGERNVFSDQFQLFVRDVTVPGGVRLLQENVDYIFQYNTFSKEVTFLSVTTFTIDRFYEIWVKNDPANPNVTGSFNGVRDLAGNFITPNRNDGSTKFFIALSNGVNDAPVNVVPNTQTVAEDSMATLSTAGGNGISVSDQDAALGTNELTVTLVAAHGTVTPTAVAGVTITTAGPAVTSANRIGVGTAAMMIGESVLVGDTIFNFVDINSVTSPVPTNVAVTPGSSATIVASTFAAVLNQSKNFGTGTALPSGNTVTLSGGLTASDPSSATVVLSGATITATDGATSLGSHVSVGGTVFAFAEAATIGVAIPEEIVIDAADTDLVVAAKIAATLNTFFGAGTASVSGTAINLTGVNTEDSLVTLSGPIQSLNLALQSVQFSPDANYHGPASVTVVTEDNGEFTVNNRTNARDVDVIPFIVTPVNDDPTIDAIADQSILEDTATLQVNLTGLTAGPAANTPPNEIETIRITATSSDTSIVPDPTVNYTFFETLGALEFAPVADMFGVVTVTVTVEDAGLDNVFDDDLSTAGVDESADNLSTVLTFTITVNAVNDAPTLAPISNQSIDEDTGPGSVNLTGISPGPGGESENVRFTAASSNTNIIVNPVVTYTNPDSTGTLAYDLVSDAFGGPVTITVTAEDAGLDNIFDDDPNTGVDESADNLSTVQTFDVVVNPINDLPTIDPILDESHPEDGGQKFVSLSGITNGAANETESVVVAATSSDTSIIPDPLVLYTFPSQTGTLVYEPLPDAFGGPVTISLTLMDGGLDGIIVDDPGTAIDESADNGITIETFDVTITEVNDLPEIDPIATQSIDEDTGPGTVSLSGVNNGAANEDDAIRITATSSDTSIVANPVVTYTSGDTTGQLSYDLVADAFGSVDVTVTVEDAGVDNVLGTADDGVTTTTFTINVNPVNDAPLIAPLADTSIDEDTGPGVVALMGIDNGPANETENVRISAVSSDTSIIPDPVITYSSLDPTGTLTYSLVQDQFGGPVVITVTVEDAGLDGIFDDDPATGLVDESLDNLTTVETFEVVVNPVNDVPTLLPIADQSIDEDTGPRIVALEGITSGPPNETETVVITAASSDESLIPTPIISYNFNDTTGTLTYDLVADQHGGPVTITVTATDAGLDGIVGNADDGVTVETFDVTVNPVNDLPTIDGVSIQTVNEDSVPPTVALTGITSGAANEVQTLMVSAVSSDTTIVTNPVVTYSSADTTAALDYTLVGDAFGGPVTITVTVQDSGLDGILGNADDGSTDTTFEVNVLPVNDDPTIDPIANRSIDEDSGIHTVTMTGITNGPPNETEQISVTAVSSDPSLIPDPTVAYTSGSATGVLSYAPTSNNFGGPVTITVTVTDAGLDNILGNGDDASITETFDITVLPVNDTPTLNPIPTSITTEDSVVQTVALSGITAGPANEIEGLRVTAAVDSGSVLIVPSGGAAVGQVITVDGIDFTYVTSATGVNTDILIVDVVTLVTVDSTFEVAEATAEALNAYFGAGTASASGNTVSSALAMSTASAALQVVPFSSVVANPVISYTSPSSTGTLSYNGLPNMFGTVTVTVTVTDNGLDDVAGNADDASTTQQLTIIVNAVNDLPTLLPLDDLYLNVSDSQQVVNLTGISNGPVNELEDVRFTITSTNTDLIPTPVLSYTGGTSGTLTFTPVAGVAGASIITVLIEDAGVDGVFDDPLTPENEAADNRRLTQTFRVSTPPIISSPVGEIVDNTPLITFTQIPDVTSYEIRLANITEDTFVFGPGNFAQTAVNSFQVPSVLPLGEYQLDVRAIDARNVTGPWSEMVSFTVAPPPAILTPTSTRLPDSTPTFSWTSIPGAETYNLEIINAGVGTVVFSATGLTATQLNIENPLPLGAYEYTITAVNTPSATSAGSTVTSSVTSNLTISTPPEVLTPPVATYNRRPTITWREDVPAVVSDVEVFNVTSNQLQFVQQNVIGTTYTLSASQTLPDGEYRIRVRSYADAFKTVGSDFSNVHVFQVGSPPVLLGPADNPLRTVDLRPELTFRGSLTGESYRVWLTNRDEGTVVFDEVGITSEGHRPSVDLPIGSYTYWVQAMSGDETSPWSQSYDFQVVTPPTINVGPRSTFDQRPTVTWNVLEGADEYLVWINRVDVVPAVIHEVTTVTGTSYQPTVDLTNGKYKIWVRGVASNDVANVRDTVSNYSVPFEFSVGGRPIVTSPSATSDPTPTFTWEAVGLASSYEVFISDASAPGVAIIRQTGISSTSFTPSTDLPEGEYRFWVRAFGPTGQATAWSLNSSSQVTVSPLVPPTLAEIQASSDTTPTFAWTAVPGAFSYRLFVAPVGSTSSPVIDVTVSTSTHTAQTPLAPGSYRAWVRTITANNQISSWSVPITFTIAEAETQSPKIDDGSQFVFTSFAEAHSLELPASDVTVSQIAAVVVENNGRQVSTGNQQAVAVHVAPFIAQEVAKSTELDVIAYSDDVMQEWDAAIWDEESAVDPAVETVVETVVERKAERVSWAASLAALTPAMLRRRRKKD